MRRLKTWLGKNINIWLVMFILGLALMGVERGWKAVCGNAGLGLVGWCIGRALRR